MLMVTKLMGMGLNVLLVGEQKITATGQYAASHVHAVAAGIVDQLYQIVGSKDLPGAAKEVSTRFFIPSSS